MNSISIIRMIKSREEMGRTFRRNEKRNAYRKLAGKPEGRRPLRNPRRRWVDNIKFGLGER
jgi:hypothetical protein